MKDYQGQDHLDFQGNAVSHAAAVAEKARLGSNKMTLFNRGDLVDALPARSACLSKNNWGTLTDLHLLQ